jgi:hypothetical protein
MPAGLEVKESDVLRNTVKGMNSPEIWKAPEPPEPPPPGKTETPFKLRRIATTGFQFSFGCHSLTRCPDAESFRDAHVECDTVP